MKKITFKNKILILLSFVFIFISSFAISTFAYYEDSNGNLVSSNLANTSLFELGAINISNGGNISNNDRMRSNYIEIKPSTKYSLKWDNAGVNYFLYDKNKVCIFHSVGGTFTTTSATKYIRFYSGLIDVNTQIMFNEGIPMAYEPYGVYYSQSNYDNAYSSGFNTATFNSFKSIMYYANFEEIWLSYQTNNNDAIRYLGLVYAGRLCESDVGVRADLWSNPNYDYPIANNWEENISSSFGLFYMTNWSLYRFIQESADNPSINPDREARLYMKFITPQNLFNTDFKLSSWQRVRFIDIYGKVTDFTSTQGVFSVELYNISEILCFGTGDFADDNYYIVSDPSSASFNSGYNLGFDDGIQQNTDKISELNTEIVSLHDTIDILQHQIENLTNSTSNYQHLLWTVASTPWESFNKIWNVEFGGINIANIVTGFVTALLVIYLIKKIWK